MGCSRLCTLALYTSHPLQFQVLNYLLFALLCLESIFARWEVVVLLRLSECLPLLLCWCESLTDGPGLLHTEVQRLVRALTVGLAQGAALSLVVHGQHASDGLADDGDLCEFGCSPLSRDLGHSELAEFRLEIIQLLQQILLAQLTKLMCLQLACGIVEQQR